MEDNEETECFIKGILPNLKKRHNMKHISVQENIEFWEK